MIPADVSDYRVLARRRLPRFLFDYLDGGANAELTLRANVADMQAVGLKQRVLRDVSELNLSTELFGQKLSMPVVLSPVGISGLFARRGEAQAARAAAAAGVPLALSTLSICSLEEIAAATGKPFWFQLYMIKDRGFMRELLSRAKAANCSALLFTVDLPVPGSRYADVRSGLSKAHTLAAKIERAKAIASRPGWAWDVGVMGGPHTFGNVASAMTEGSNLEQFWKWVGASFDPGITWKDLDWIRETWDRPLVIKGVLDVEDARQAAKLGADGVVVSNHGGRQLDGVASPISVLPQIAQAVGARTTVLMDGGVRSGLDVVRAMASGAKGVLIGRAWAYALAARGGQGVSDILELFRKEIATALALTGVPDVNDLGPDTLDVAPVKRR
jgi:L-lactate dehydrogenase (cytochrome)